MRYEDLVRLVQDREPIFSKKTAPDDDDDEDSGLMANMMITMVVQAILLGAYYSS